MLLLYNFSSLLSHRKWIETKRAIVMDKENKKYFCFSLRTFRENTLIIALLLCQKILEEGYGFRSPFF